MVQFCWDVGTRTRPNAIGFGILIACFLTCQHHLKCQSRNAVLRPIGHEIFCLLVLNLFILYGFFFFRNQAKPAQIWFDSYRLILFSLVQISYCSVMFPHLWLVPYSLHTTSRSYCSASIQAVQRPQWTNNCWQPDHWLSVPIASPDLCAALMFQRVKNNSKRWRIKPFYFQFRFSLNRSRIDHLVSSFHFYQW